MLEYMEYELYRTYNDRKPQSFEVCAVWIMDHALPSMFTKLFTINDVDINPVPNLFLSQKILGFTKNGKLIMETQDDYYIEGVDLAFYEPNLEHINDIGINGKDGSLFVSSCKETLLLLNKLDCSVLF